MSTTAYDLSWADAKLQALNAFCKIEELAALKPNWDSYGAPAISERALDRAMDILWTIRRSPQPRIVPTAEGGVQLEWYTASEELEVEIRPDGNVEYLLEVVDPDSRSTEEHEGKVYDDVDVILLIPFAEATP
jgi:hypothetical protein